MTVIQRLTADSLTLFLDGGDFTTNLMTNASCIGEDPSDSSSILVVYQSLLFSIKKEYIKFQMNAQNYSILKLKPSETYIEYSTTDAFKAFYNTYLINS